MTEQLIDSPSWGLLRLAVPDDNPEPARPWRAVILHRPARLGHLVQTAGATEDDAVGVMALAVERYDAVGLVPRGPVREYGYLPVSLAKTPGELYAALEG